MSSQASFTSLADLHIQEDDVLAECILQDIARQQAERVLFTRKKPLINYWGYGYRTLLPSAILEEMPCNVMMAAFEAMRSGRYRAQGQMNAYLRQIFQNKIHFQLRAYTRRRRIEQQAVAAGFHGTRPTRDGPFLAERRLLVDDLRRIVDLALSALTETNRYIVVRYVFEGWCHEAIARDLNLSQEAVRQRLSRSLTLLRAFFGAYPGTAALFPELG